MAVRVLTDSRSRTTLGAPDLMSSFVVSSMVVSSSTKRASAGSTISETWMARQSRATAAGLAVGCIKTSCRAAPEKECWRWARGEEG